MGPYPQTERRTGEMAKLKEGNIVDLDKVNELWKAVFTAPLTHYTAFILADDAEMALKKARDYQRSYTLIDDSSITSLERVSTTIL
jgi:hypothetical protein